jgi:hypothetical protein
MLLKTETAVDEMNNGTNKEQIVRMGQRSQRTFKEIRRQCGLTAESRTWMMLQYFEETWVLQLAITCHN